MAPLGGLGEPTSSTAQRDDNCASLGAAPALSWRRRVVFGPRLSVLASCVLFGAGYKSDASFSWRGAVEDEKRHSDRCIDSLLRRPAGPWVEDVASWMVDGRGALRVSPWWCVLFWLFRGGQWETICRDGKGRVVSSFFFFLVFFSLI